MSISEDNKKWLKSSIGGVPTENPFYDPALVKSIKEAAKKPMSWQELHDQAESLHNNVKSRRSPPQI